MTQKQKALIIPLILFAAVFCADRLIFDKALFALSNPSGWDSFRWYNFESIFRQVENAKRDKPLVLVVGSSVAQYSTLPRLFEKELGDRYRVELISHAAMLSTDLVHYRKRLLNLGPTAIVWVANAADLDLERTTPPWEAGPARSTVVERRFLTQRAPARLYYPAEFSREGGLAGDSVTSFIMRGSLYSLRYPRDEWFPFVLFKREWNGPLKSYLNYQGESIGGGMFREGFTGACFAFPASYLTGEDFMAEIPAPLIQAGLRIRVVMRSQEVSLAQCTPPNEGEDIIPTRAGWQRIPLNNPSGVVHIYLSHVASSDRATVVVPGSPVFLGRGIRLIGNFGRKQIPTGETFFRRPNLEETRLESLPDREIVADYETRIEPPDWEKRPELTWLNRLRLAKLISATLGFHETRQTTDMRTFVTETSRVVPLLIVNQAEHPYSLENYGWSQWYADYLKFIFAMRSDRVEILDLHDALSVRELGDPHHLTLKGAEKIQPRMAQALKALIARQK
ncbi:MAG: hypothetical protein JNM27_15685 [Leptospirales bacterium]|nr:hypothetical protein [Leptospirales bacterium]